MSSKSEVSPRLRELSEKAELLRFSYVDESGYPRVVPLWFVAVDGELCAGTSAKSKKWKSIRHNSRAGWSIDGGENHHYWAMSGYGQVEEITDASKRAQVYKELGVKYFGSPEDEKFVEIYGKADDPET